MAPTKDVAPLYIPNRLKASHPAMAGLFLSAFLPKGGKVKSPYITSVTTPTPPTKPLPGREAEMAKNDAGGFVFNQDDWSALERFVILGAEGGTYYVNQHELVLRNVAVVNRCIVADPAKTAEIVAQVSESGRAFKNNVAAFVLSYMVSKGGPPRFAAYRVLNRVIRTGRALLEFHRDLDALGVKSNASRRKAMARWIDERKPSDLIYQMLKYPTSGNLSMRDVIRYAHAHASQEAQNVMAYILDNGKANLETLPEIAHGWEAAKRAQTAQEVAEIVTKYKLTWELVPGQWQGSHEVWQALLPNLPYTALLRNLARLSSYDMLKMGSANAKLVRDRLVNADIIKRARVHPMSLLVAWRTYASGGTLGKTKFSWKPTSVVADALEEAFYLAFDAVEPSGKSMMVALDVSGSMSGQAGTLPLACCEVSAVMAMVTLRAERNSMPVAFHHGISDLNLSRHDSLDAVLRKVKNINAGGTDCSLPMVHALNNGMTIDQFVVLTDNETYAGKIHPATALQKYRDLVVKDAKLVVVGMTSNGFTIADPQDRGMLDIAGISTDVPALISKFAAGL